MYDFSSEKYCIGTEQRQFSGVGLLPQCRESWLALGKLAAQVKLRLNWNKLHQIVRASNQPWAKSVATQHLDSEVQQRSGHIFQTIIRHGHALLRKLSGRDRDGIATQKAYWGVTKSVSKYADPRHTDIVLHILDFEKEYVCETCIKTCQQ